MNKDEVMMMNKGISAIIAVVLLLLIAIALAGSVYLYSSGIIGGKTAKTISVSDMYCNVTGYITVVLSNDGTASIADSDLTVLVDNGDRSANYDFETISPHDVAIVVSTVTESSGEHTVLITSPSNAIRQVIYC